MQNNPGAFMFYTSGLRDKSKQQKIKPLFRIYTKLYRE